MFSALLVVALSQAAVANAALMPEWNTDYSLALRSATSAGKPLAIFIGSGKDGWQQVCANGALNDASLKLLRERYICLYVNRGQAEHKDLLAALAPSPQPALVLSDKSAKYQIFKEAGPLSEERLVRALEQHVAYEVPSQPVVRQSYYAPSTPASSGRICVG